MSCRSKLAELLPFYAAGSLGEEERRAVAAHLAACADCRAELAFWQEVASAVAAEDRLLPAPSPVLVDRALVGAQRRRASPFVRAWVLLAAQVPLVRREIWSASALVMALGCLIAILQGGSASASIIEAVAPVVAAAGLAMLYGPESDPGLELALATPTSPRQVLLARLVVVYGYDLILGVAASVGVLAVVPAGLLGQLILGWLAPMAFLSALALVLSMVIGTGNAITAALMLWLARGLASGLRMGTMGPPAAPEAAFVAALQAYAGLWQSTGLLFALAAALLAVAVALAGQGERLVAQKA
ncbi:MAG: zf-HC2 domain-containing protein [Anaerolineae bacterium]|nr:zf-HC2 domain-containing protein [Anaerolineae bacterium]